MDSNALKIVAMAVAGFVLGYFRIIEADASLAEWVAFIAIVVALVVELIDRAPTVLRR